MVLITRKDLPHVWMCLFCQWRNRGALWRNSGEAVTEGLTPTSGVSGEAVTEGRIPERQRGREGIHSWHFDACGPSSRAFIAELQTG